jgi:DNA mismatch repair protein MutS2
MISELTKKRQEYDAKISQISLKETELEGFKSLYRTRADDLKIKRKKYEEESLVQAQEILNEVNKTIESVIREIRESKAKPEIIKHGREQIKRLQKKLADKRPSVPANIIAIENLKIGQMVESIRFSVSGQISKLLTDKNQLEIDANGVKMTIPLSDVSIREEKDTAIKETSAKRFHQSPQVGNELDLRGKIAEEALIELKHYLDLALNSTWQEVRIIHGKGTGALRSIIHGYLKKNKKIKSYRLGNYGEGDTGVTVIEI